LEEFFRRTANVPGFRPSDGCCRDAVGLVAALGVTQVVAGLLIGVSATDPLRFVVSAPLPGWSRVSRERHPGATRDQSRPDRRLARALSYRAVADCNSRLLSCSYPENQTFHANWPSGGPPFAPCRAPLQGVIVDQRLCRYGWDEPPLSAIAWRLIAQLHLGQLCAHDALAAIGCVSARLRAMSAEIDSLSLTTSSL
jgi:hypothetical protein